MGNSLAMDYDEDGWLEYGFTDTDIAYSLKNYIPVPIVYRVR